MPQNLFRDTPNLTADELRSRLDLWFAEYDRTIHTTTKETPLDRWAADPAPLRRADDAKLRSGLLVDPRARIVQGRKGVFFRNRYWMSSALMDIIGRTVQVRYPVGSDDFLEIYREGKWVCTVWPAENLTEAQRTAIFDRRWDSYSEARELHDRALRVRMGAEEAAGATDATPAVASMPAEDPLGADPNDLYALLARPDPVDDREDAESARESGATS